MNGTLDNIITSMHFVWMCNDIDYLLPYIADRR